MRLITLEIVQAQHVIRCVWLLRKMSHSIRASSFSAICTPLRYKLRIK